MVNPKKIVTIPETINSGLSSAKNSTMLSILGMPRDNFTDECRQVVNEPLRSLIVHGRDVGPFKVSGLKPAVESLTEIMIEIRSQHRDVYDVMGSSGMLCARFIRGTQRISNHSWGSALDINIAGALDGISVGAGTGRSDGKTLAGLAAIAPIFNEAGWFWGVGFSSFEDGMHFEVADETIRAWHAAGKLGDRSVPKPNLSIGDRGIEVRLLQEALFNLGFDILPDGIFGPITRAMVIDFQASKGLDPDGVVGPQTKAELGLG